MLGARRAQCAVAAPSETVSRRLSVRVLSWTEASASRLPHGKSSWRLATSQGPHQLDGRCAVKNWRHECFSEGMYLFSLYNPGL
jgi:hypothetical protein